MPSSRDHTSSHLHLPYDALATEDAFKATSPLSSRHVIPTKSFALQCLLPPLIGLSFVGLGLYIVYTPDPIIISYSTTNTIVLSQAFTALFAIWHFLALMPVLDAVRSVRSEEWWRRLTHSASFSRVNAVSSNIGGNLAHGLDILGPWSSYVYQAAWLIAILCVAIADISPGAIHVDIGLRAIDAEYKVPALPPDSIFGNYSRPFYMTNDFFHASVDIAPMYYASLLVAQSYVTAGPPVPNAIVPRPSVTAGTGYRYSTDVAFLNYQCDWYAPELAGPETMTDYTVQNLSITANDIRGIGYAPTDSNSIYIINDNRNATTNQPSFAGDLVFIASSGTPVTPEYGFLNLSTIPTYALSPAWTAVAAAYRANYTGIFSPPQYLSAAVCTSNFTIESWTVEMMGGVVKLLEQHPQRIGNLDAVQLQLAIQDSFGMLIQSAPMIPAWGFSETSFVTFFSCPTDPYLLCVPKSGADISAMMNTEAIPSLIQAYLDDFPFGNFTPDGSKYLAPALVLVAQKGFVYLTAGLYVLLGITLIFIFGRVPAPALDIQQVIDVTQSADSQNNADTLEGRAVATTVERIAQLGRDGNDAETENRVRHVIGSSTVTFRENNGLEEQPTLALETATRVFTPNTRRERIENARNRYTWILTPALGTALVAFGLEVYLRPRAIASATAARATVYASLFTWVIGVWRSASLVAITALLRRANSDEWSRFLRRRDRSGLPQKMRSVLNTLSTNRLSFSETFRPTWLTNTTLAYKICYIAAIVASVCAVVSQGAVTLLTLPALTTEILPIPIITSLTPIDVPWSSDHLLGPHNDARISLGILGTNWVYLEHVVGAVVLEGLPSEFIVPIRGVSFNTNGSQYPTDVAQIACTCSWVAPVLPAATANASYISVGLDEFDIVGLQAPPEGVATFAPLANMTFASNSSAVTSGLFAWTLWGGGPGDPVNLDAVPYTDISPEWQQLIAAEYAPAYFAYYDGRDVYATNLTRASTLVCQPHMTIMPKTARAFGGLMALSPPPPKYSAGVGNFDEAYAAFMIYTYAVQQAQDLTGVFRPNLVFGLALGNAVLGADPNNQVNGTVPRGTEDIAATMVAYIGSASKSWTQIITNPGLMMDVELQLINQSLVVTAGLPQLVITAVLYLLLALAAVVVSRRTPAVPFTLAGILMLRSELANAWIDVADEEESPVAEKSKG